MKFLSLLNNIKSKTRIRNLNLGSKENSINLSKLRQRNFKFFFKIYETNFINKITSVKYKNHNNNLRFKINLYNYLNNNLIYKYNFYKKKIKIFY
jgi:hypothetical protein